MLLQRELIFKSLLAVILCTMDCIAEEVIPAELVTRRPSGDVYRNYNSNVAFLCSEGNNLTFLIDERQCVDQQQLLNGRVVILNYLSIANTMSTGHRL